jgi:UDP-N-acetylglucosamine 2-epimerase
LTRMRVMTIVGTRPEFIQTAPFSRRARERGVKEVFVHTGQHYDANMSDVFFEDLNLPMPDLWLGVGGGSHATQTGEILMGLERAMVTHAPDWVVVYGDTNSTVAAAMAAAKLHLPIAHIEAGLRSFDRAMPEEINRVVTDHVADLLLAPTQAAMENLAREGLSARAVLTGDVRVDLLSDLQPRIEARWPALAARLGLPEDGPFALATIHRASNTDDPAALRGIVEAINHLPLLVILPVHPRLRKMLVQFNLDFSHSVTAVEPLGYLDMLAALHACSLVITDSGGLQKEAYMLRRPTVTVRTTTEWIETVEVGWNRLAGTVPETIWSAVREALQPPPSCHPNFYGTPGVCDRILDLLGQGPPERGAVAREAVAATGRTE